VQPFLQKQLHLVEKTPLQRVFAPFWRKNSRFKNKTHRKKPFWSWGFQASDGLHFFHEKIGLH